MKPQTCPGGDSLEEWEQSSVLSVTPSAGCRDRGVCSVPEGMAQAQTSLPKRPFLYRNPNRRAVRWRDVYEQDGARCRPADVSGCLDDVTLECAHVGGLSGNPAMGASVPLHGGYLLPSPRVRSWKLVSGKAERKWPREGR